MSVKSGLNDSSDGEAVIVGGRSFHALAAAAGKARSPSDVRRVDGTTSDFDIRSTATGFDAPNILAKLQNHFRQSPRIQTRKRQ